MTSQPTDTPHMPPINHISPQSQIIPPSSNSAQLSPPRGWMNDLSHDCFTAYWEGEDSLATLLAEDYDLHNAQPILTNYPRHGIIMFLFSSPSGSDSESVTYYIWDAIGSTVYKFVEPTTLGEIYRRMDGSERVWAIDANLEELV